MLESKSTFKKKNIKPYFRIIYLGQPQRPSLNEAFLRNIWNCDFCCDQNCT